MPILLMIVLAMIAMAAGVSVRHVLAGAVAVLLLAVVGTLFSGGTGEPAPKVVQNNKLPATVEWESDGIPEWGDEDVYVEGGFGHCLVEVGGVKRYDLSADAPGYDKACDLHSLDGKFPVASFGE